MAERVAAWHAGEGALTDAALKKTSLSRGLKTIASFGLAARDVDLQGAPVGEALQRALLRHARSLVPKRPVFRYADQEVNVLIQLAGLVESMKTLACLRMHIELGW